MTYDLTWLNRLSFLFQDRCRSVILRQLTHESQIEELELPRTLKQFILEGLSGSNLILNPD